MSDEVGTGPAAAPVGDPVGDPVGQPVSDPVGDPVGQPVSDPVGDPVGQPVSEPVGQPVGDPVGQPVAEPATTKAPPTAARPPLGPAVSKSEDWASETADKLEQFVTSIRSQTTDRLLKVARVVVFGLLAAVMGVMALLLLVIASVRALDELIPFEIWLTYLILGAIITLAGLFLWSKKEQRPSPG